MENSGNDIKRIILTGPESTAKTALAERLAAKYRTRYVEEYARTYVNGLKRSYNYRDVLNIALKQVEMLYEYSKTGTLLFVDTYLIITKVWFLRKFDYCPEWIDTELRKTRNDLYLLCKPDIPWVEDGIRENGGEMREVLYREYENELKQAGLNFVPIGGTGEDRFLNACTATRDFIKEDDETTG
ncbi:MAG: ATP-binding protein [Bacteroidales bacterium]